MQGKLTADASWLAGELLSAVSPPRAVTVAQWAEAERIIPRGNAEPGRWSNARAPYLVEVMQAVNDDSLHTVVIAGCSQSGKTALAENVVGWAACVDPCTVVWACPTDGGAETASSRLDALINETPTLKPRFGDRTARSRTNNTGLKEFEGGKLVIVSAGSPSSLASHPARLVIADEVDRFPVNLRKEGDPIALLRARQTTFARRKLLAMSSPTQEGISRIEALFKDGDQREWFWACDCGEEHVPDWENVKWTPAKPHEARYEMPCCGQVLDDAQRWAAMARGSWRSTAAGTSGVRSYRFRGLSSPWLRLGDLAREFEAAGNSPVKLAPFYNTRLGLPYEADRGEGAEAEVVRGMAEDYTDIVPRDAALLTAGVDIQAGWLALTVVAWGLGDEAWVMQWHELHGDVRDPATWENLADLLDRKWKHAGGAEMQIEAVAVDSGYETQAVYEFTTKHRMRGKRWFPTKGMPGGGKPLWVRGNDVNRSLSKLFLVGVHGGKTQVMAGISQKEHGPGKIHTRADLADHYWDWLCSEELVAKDVAGGTKTEWRIKKNRRRNEALDTLVLALAARYSQDFGIAERLARLQEGGPVKAPKASIADLAARMAKITNAQHARN